MRKRGFRKSWFQTLRRDSRLFAVVGFLALFLGSMQPLVAAASTSVSDGFVICTTYGIGKAGSGNQEHPRDVECPLCVSGHSCSLQLVVALATTPASVAAPVLADAKVNPVWDDRQRASRSDDPPPSIRAPPFPSV